MNSWFLSLLQKHANESNLNTFLVENLATKKMNTEEDNVPVTSVSVPELPGPSSNGSSNDTSNDSDTYTDDGNLSNFLQLPSITSW